jgi:hypothetical protein
VAELVTPDGRPVEAEAAEVNREFARAMAADQPEPAAPPRRAPAGPPAPAEKRGRGRPPKSERARVAPAAAAGPLSDAERAQGVAGLVQIGSGVCLLASRAKAKTVPDGKGGTRREDNPALKADAITLASNAEQLAAACAETAKHDARFAAVLDKVCAVGPYGALIGAVMGVGTQLIRNHKPSAALPGTVDPAQLLRQAETQQAAA